MICDEKNIREAYCTYGVDLIRTTGLLLHLSPSSIYRASILFQRFQKSADEQYRSHYMKEAEQKALVMLEKGVLDGSQKKSSVKEFVEKTGKVEYILPEPAAASESEVVPLGDLFAPFDYCLMHQQDHDDILYLAGACLLVVSKLEEQHVRIRDIVNMCNRLSQRRKQPPGSPIQQRPSPQRYEDYKSCVVSAEGVLLQQLGFQTFVDCPIKYGVIFLHLLVEDTTGGQTCSDELYRWQVEMVRFVNDTARYGEYLSFSAKDVAVLAIQVTCPPEVALPEEWYLAFGTSADTLSKLTAVYEAKKETGLSSKAISNELRNVLVYMYRSRTDFAKTQFELKTAKETPIAPPSTEVKSTAPPVPQPTTAPAPPPPVKINLDEFEDIAEVQKRRRREEKERREKEKEDKERHRKRDREDSRDKGPDRDRDRRREGGHDKERDRRDRDRVRERNRPYLDRSRNAGLDRRRDERGKR
ncbi:hypothetical protein, conserved [Angomonas deanei]|uniref:Cyclin, N-terminal domain containing protein n=1 Tax=Angomonas deanei TaxID=59799 RepID=A0A7G2C0V9_9TRYP|nr:hypothetical protein, conserved [Angomonas deanei]